VLLIFAEIVLTLCAVVLLPAFFAGACSYFTALGTAIAALSVVIINRRMLAKNKQS
jgi:hypothetical protein